MTNPPNPQPDPVDEASAESFPASDPPSWEPLHPGAPDAHPDHRSHETDTTFGGTVPEFYDRHLGPLLFEPYAVDLARRLEMPANAQVLELACGTGRLTRHLRQRLPVGGRLTATELYDAMLTIAKAKIGASADVEWRQADATALPFLDASFDTVVCQFGVMFFQNLPQAMHEAWRVLRPGGSFQLNVWDSKHANPLARIADENIPRFFADDPPDFYSIPYGLHDEARLRRLLSDAGFADVAIEPVALIAESPSARDAAVGLIRGNPVVDAIRQRGTASVEVVEETLADALRSELGDQPLRAPTRAKVLRAYRAAP